MIQKRINIAIDGYSSCGKSTIAKAIAKKLQYIYVDTGAMYRAVTLYCLDYGIIKDKYVDLTILHESLPNINVSFVYNQKNEHSETYLNNENVEKRIREMDVSGNVSLISSVKEVRQKLVAIQQSIGKQKGVVMDGRDIGTVVFPDAELKLFMTADNDVRAQRRFEELTVNGSKVSLDEVRKNIEERDYIDTHRTEDPLRQAKDAIILNNTDLTIEEQLKIVLDLIEERL